MLSLEVFILKAQRRWIKLPGIKVPVTQLKILGFSKTLKRTYSDVGIAAMAAHTCTHRERYSHTQEVFFSPSLFLQNLFVRNGSRHWSFDCVDIFPKHKTVLVENQALPAFSRPSLMHCLWGPPVLLEPEPNLRSSPKQTPPCYTQYIILQI